MPKFKKFKVFTTGPGVGAKPLTWEQANSILSCKQMDAGEARGKLSTFGMWQIPVSYSALATTQDFSETGPLKDCLTVFGPRKLVKVRESGHELEGRVSVGGKAYRGFTSSTLFQLPDGRLVSVAIIHVCCNQTTKKV